MNNYIVIIEAQINIKANSKEEAELLVSKSFGEYSNKLQFDAIIDEFENKLEECVKEVKEYRKEKKRIK